ncbi:MAG: hypothetical protein MJY54_01270 [archaeon]|nr:hypothetical protein [archaeon]
MNVREVFDSIRNDIKDGNYQIIRQKVGNLIDSNPQNIDVMLECASLLKTVDDDEYCQSIIDRVLDIVESPNFGVAIAIRNLGRISEAYGLMKDFSCDSEKQTEIAKTLMMMDEPKKAMEILEKRDSHSKNEELLRCDVLCSLGNFDEALSVAKKLVNKKETTYDVLSKFCNILMRMGRDNDAIKMAKFYLKENKESADYLALMSYVMYVGGKIPAAVNYACRALKKDCDHIGALEIMAMCLIEKQKYLQAKLLAGAINDKDPGSITAINILDMCRKAQK